MAGLFCIVEPKERPVSDRVVEGMLAAGRHRSPAGAGVFRDGNLALAQLELFPGTSATHRPFPLSALGGALVLACDARLDEREALKDRLEILTEEPTDAELILAAYRRWGSECPRHLVGDFAFVLWDRDEARLFCARDPFGIKPLRYFFKDGTFCAASEAQQILEHPKASRRLDEGALGRYLLDDETHESATFFKEVHKLPPGHALVLQEGRLKTSPVAELSLPPEIRYSREEEYAEHFLEVLRRAVTDRLRPGGRRIGIFLSGGLDSSSVAALAQERLEAEGRPSLLAASYAFPTLPDCDETRWSSVLAEETGIDLRYLNAEEHGLLRDPGVFHPDLETPFQGWRSADQRIFEIFRDGGAQVALTGLGGDNLTQGSHQVFRSLLRRGEVTAAFRGLAKHAGNLEISTPRAALHFLLAPALPAAARRIARRALGRGGEDRPPAWLHPDFLRRSGIEKAPRRTWSRRVSKDPARQVQFDLVSVLDTTARSCFWLDRLGACYGIEARHPFLDLRLARFVLAIPPEQVFDGSQRKALLRKAMAGRLPESLRTRRGKTRFKGYIDRSLCQEGSAVVRELLGRGSALAEMGIVEPAALATALDDYLAGKDDQGFSLVVWYLLTLELWLRSHTCEGRSPLSSSGFPTSVDPALEEVRIAV